MSLHDPAHRPWGSARGARIISLSAWGLVSVGALLAAVWWVQSLQGDESALVPAIVAFNVSIFAGIGALFVDLATAQRRGLEETTALPRLPGAWISGAGLGTMIAQVLTPGPSITWLGWGLLILAGGALIFVSPMLLERYRSSTTRFQDRIRAVGIRTSAAVTNVRTFSRDDFTRYRVTLRFTDQHGDQRWFTQTAPAGIRAVTTGMQLPLHYDPANPGRKRSLVVDWPTW